jgi:hypothetical protein
MFECGTQDNFDLAPGGAGEVPDLKRSEGGEVYSLKP